MNVIQALPPAWYNVRPYEPRFFISKNTSLPHLRNALIGNRNALPGLRHRPNRQSQSRGTKKIRIIRRGRAHAGGHTYLADCIGLSRIVSRGWRTGGLCGIERHQTYYEPDSSSQRHGHTNQFCNPDRYILANASTYFYHSTAVQLQGRGK